MAIKWIVPNINRDLRDKIRREAYVTNEIIIRTELLKAKGVIGSCGNFLEPNEDFYTQENANNLRNTVKTETEVTDLDGLHHGVEHVGINSLLAWAVLDPVRGGPGPVHCVVFRHERSQSRCISEYTYVEDCHILFMWMKGATKSNTK